jgi:hypothetical protein
MASEITQLRGVASTLLQQVALFRSPSIMDSAPIGISSLEPETVHALFQQLQPRDSSHSQDLATLLGESRSCLQLIAGFLGAVRDLPSLPAVVRFEVSDLLGHAIPVAMPAASAAAMIRDAKRLASSLEKFGRRRNDA